MEDNTEAKYYSQNDHLAAIGFQAQPGDIYYMNPPKELNTYPMYINDPKKVEKTIGSFIQYTMDGTDITEPLYRRYSDFFALHQKLIQRWPGIYIPPIPPKKISGNLDPNLIKTRMRLLNRFCLNLSNIEYLYKSEETNIFRNNIPEVANAINKLPELNYGEILARMKEAFPEYNENYDIIVGKGKFSQFESFLTINANKIKEFREMVNNASEKRETDIKQFLELIKNFTNYEKENMINYADKNENALIFNNPSFNNLSEKIIKLKQEMINPFVAFKDWLQEEELDVDAMQLAIKRIQMLIETEGKLVDKLKSIQEDIKKDGEGAVNFFKSIFKKKEEILAQLRKEEQETQEKIDNIREIIKIVGDNMENQIEVFKNDKANNYYKYLKMFAIMQRESNRVVRELWDLVKEALNQINPKEDYNDDNPPKNNDDYVPAKNYQIDQNENENEIHDEKEEEQQQQPEEKEEKEEKQDDENHEE